MPGFDDPACHRQVAEDVFVEAFVAEAAVGVEFEVAIGQAAMGGSLAGSSSINNVVSSAIPSICM